MPTLVDDARLDRMKCGEPPHNYASELSDGRVEKPATVSSNKLGRRRPMR